MRKRNTSSLSTKGNSIVKDKRGVSILSQRIDSLLLGVLIPMSMNKINVSRSITSFNYTDDDLLLDSLFHIKSIDPTLLSDRDRFMKSMERVYNNLNPKYLSLNHL